MATGSSKKRSSSSGRRSQGTSSKSSSRRKTTANRKSATRRKKDNGLMDEIILLIFIALSIIMFLSTIGFVGNLGNIISGIMFGIFGIVSFVIPIAIGFGAVFYVLNKGLSIVTVKAWSLVVLIIDVCAFSQLLFFPDNIDINSIKDYYTSCSELKRGGGIIGGTVFSLLNKGIGTAGSVIVLIVLLIIVLILLSERSFIDGIAHGSKAIYANVKEEKRRRALIREEERPIREREMELRRIEQEERRFEREERRRNRYDEFERKQQLKNERRLEQKRAALEKREKETQLRMDKRVSGVMLDTKITKASSEVSTNVVDDIHEISITNDGNLNNLEYNAAVNSSYDEYKDNDFNEIVFESSDNDNYIEYDSVKNSHSIAVDTTGIRTIRDSATSYTNGYLSNNEDVYEYENAILNETEKLSDVDDYDPVVKDVYDSYTSFVDDDLESPEEEYEVNDRQMRVAENRVINRPQAVKSNPHDKYKEKRKSNRKYVFPSINLLKKGSGSNNGDSKRELEETARNLKDTLEQFGVKVTMEGYTQGPSITRFEMKPERGVKVSKILGLTDDIMLSMAAVGIRIEAPIPGKSAIGIELPNKVNSTVMFRDLIESSEFKKADSKVSFAVGKGLGGETIVANIAKMPHLLIAGTTGSGKSVCINTLIMSILYKASPEEVKLIMVDPKVVELSVYNGIPHLMIPVVTDPKQASEALKWGVVEMDDRYNKFATYGVRDIKGYNEKVRNMTDIPAEERPQEMPQLIIIVDELADLMMVASKEVEESICRLAQKARAAGIHLIIATQRPSVDVITGLIKANIPSRIAFKVSSGIDSRTILDVIGAEKLLGNGDMLFYPQGASKPTRVQGGFVSDKEVNDVVEFLKEHSDGETYNADVAERIKNVSSASESGGMASGSLGSDSGKDEYFVDAAKLIIDKNKASIGMLQRAFKIGFNRAARIMDQLADAGVVGEEEGTKPRRVLMSEEQFEQYVEEVL